MGEKLTPSHAGYLVNLDEVKRCYRCGFEKPNSHFNGEHGRTESRRGKICRACRESRAEVATLAVIAPKKPQAPIVPVPAGAALISLFPCPHPQGAARLTYRHCLERRAQTWRVASTGEQRAVDAYCAEECDQGKANAAHFAPVVQLRRIKEYGKPYRVTVTDPRSEITSALHRAQEAVTMAGRVVEGQTSCSECGKQLRGESRKFGKCFKCRLGAGEVKPVAVAKSDTAPKRKAATVQLAPESFRPELTAAPKFQKQDLPAVSDLPSWYVTEVVLEARRRVVQLAGALDVGNKQPSATTATVVVPEQAEKQPAAALEKLLQSPARALAAVAEAATT